MSKREKLPEEAIKAFVDAHPGWQFEGGALAKSFAFDDYASGIAFVVRVGFAAEKRDHHPHMLVGWCKVKVTWSTHDRGGVTGLDTDLAEVSDQLHAAWLPKIS